MIRIVLAAAVVMGSAFAGPACAFQTARQPVAALELSGIAVDISGAAENIGFSFRAIPGKKNEPGADVQKLAQKNLEYFFIGLALPGDTFWVNLNPAEPEAVIDPVLKDTDVGRIILAADLRLKKDVAALTNPRTSETGREYWDKVYAKAEELGIEQRIPLVNRVWIVPQEAQVHETTNELSVVSSPLQVCLESEYFGGDSDIRDPGQKALMEYSNQVMRELVIPLLTQKVNEGAAYAELRAVYRSLVLAQWYREKFCRSAQSILRNAASTALRDSSIDSPYQPEQIYTDYLVSMNKGEYNFSETENGRLDFYLRVITRDYFSGGVDFRQRSARRQVEKQASQGAQELVLQVTFKREDTHLLAKAKRSVAAGLAARNSETAQAALKNMLSVIEHAINNLPGVAVSRPNGTLDLKISRKELNSL